MQIYATPLMCLKRYLNWKILFFREIHWRYVIKDVLIIAMIIHSFKIFSGHFWLVKTTCILVIHYISSCCWPNLERTLSYWTNDIKWQSETCCRLLNHWPRKPEGEVVLFFGEQNNKQQNGETPLIRTGKYVEWIIKQLLF